MSSMLSDFPKKFTKFAVAKTSSAASLPSCT